MLANRVLRKIFGPERKEVTGGSRKLHAEVLANFLIVLIQAVAHLVEALRYNPEGRGFDSRWCLWNFSLT